MKKPIEIIDVFRCVDIDTTYMEPLEEWHWISKTQKAQRWALKGVSTSVIDFYIVDRSLNTLIPDDHVMVVELSKKVGKYDHSKRDHICIKFVPAHQSPSSCVGLHSSCDDEQIHLHIGELMYSYFYFKDFALKNPDHIEGIVRWHFDRYYKFLDNSDIKSAVVQLSEYIDQNNCTLASINRAASRILYDHAKVRGFRKLTKQQQKRLGLSGQWHTEAEYATALSKIENSRYHPSGVSDYSLRESRGVAEHG
jgi:hypothetical protein